MLATKLPGGGHETAQAGVRHNRAGVRNNGGRGSSQRFRSSSQRFRSSSQPWSGVYNVRDIVVYPLGVWRPALPHLLGRFLLRESPGRQVLGIWSAGLADQ